MRNIISKSLLLAVVVLAGCASGVKYTDMKPELVSADSSNSRIFIYRKTTLGAAVQPKVRLNDEVIGVSRAQGFFYVDRPAGKYVLSTSTEVERNISFVLSEGETRYIRQNVSFGFFVGHIYGELVEESMALKDLESCKYTGDQVP
jgi:hypothetical protein